MKITKRADYGLRAMVELSVAQKGQFVSVPTIAKRQGLSINFVEEIMQMLATSNLVHAQRGRRGGYALTRPAEQISIKEIVEVLEGPLNLVTCLDPNQDCPILNRCPTSAVWFLLSQRVADEFAQISLKDAYQLWLEAKQVPVEPQKRNVINAISDRLPGTNCQACGYPSCQAFAAALLQGESVPQDCFVGNQEMYEEIEKDLNLIEKR